jgi:hypothetical protein
MAPEISTGNYNKQIDVYAAGVILYEMLTGRVPFDGESAGEVLMKHLTAPPDLSKVPRDYVPVLARALSKNPIQRYANLAEMARAIEEVGSDSVPVRAHRPRDPRGPAPPPVPARAAAPEPSSAGPATLGGAVGELCGSMVLAVVFAALATALWAALAQTRTLTDLGTIFFLTVSASWAVLVPTKFWTQPLEDSWARRVVMVVLGGLIGLHALWLDGWTLQGRPGLSSPVVSGGPDAGPPTLPVATFGGNADLAEAASYLCYFALVFLALRWWKMTDRRRAQRFSFGPILATGFWALILLLIWHHLRQGAVALVLASAIVQLVSPWQQPPPPVARRLRLRYA